MRKKYRHPDTGKEISRQRAWQIKTVQKGGCQICGKPVNANGYVCDAHEQANRVKNRERARKNIGATRRNLGSKSYRLEKKTSSAIVSTADLAGVVVAS